MFLGSRAGLNISANAAGYQGTLPEQFVMAGPPRAGFATAVAGDYIADLGPDQPTTNSSASSCSTGLFQHSSFAESIASLDTLDIPDYTVAAPSQAWNAFGTTTNELVELRPDSSSGSNWSAVPMSTRCSASTRCSTRTSTGDRVLPRGSTAAAYTLSSGWINRFLRRIGTGRSDIRHLRFRR